MCPIQVQHNITSKLIVINIWFLIYGGGGKYFTSFGVVGGARISVIWPDFGTVLAYLLPMRASFQGVSEKKKLLSRALLEMKNKMIAVSSSTF